MNTSAASREADASLLVSIIEGRAWVASKIRNLHFRKSCRILNRTFRGKAPLTDLLRPWCRDLLLPVARCSDLLSKPHALSWQIIPALVRVAAFSCNWVRAPSDWKPETGISPEEQWSSLLRHLFAKWPVPAFMDSVWLLPGDIIRRERHWYCHFAEGGSWRTARDMPPGISRRTIHHAMGAPARLTLIQALRWGQLQALGARQELVDAVLASPMAKLLSHEAIWSRLLEKVAACPHFEERDFGVIADLLVDLLDHGHEKRVGWLLDQSLPELRRHCYRRWQSLLNAAEANGISFRDKLLTRSGLRAELRHFSNSRWDPMEGVSPFEVTPHAGDGDASGWTIVELRCHARLAREGRSMRHCVEDYWRCCHAGRCAIFSLARRLTGDDAGKIIPHVTIEVHRKSRRVVQLRGKWNRYPPPFERSLIGEWARRNGLKMAV